MREPLRCDTLERIANMKHIILFNGPPRSGKDTAAEHLLHHYHEVDSLMKFAHPLKMAVKAFYGLTDEQWEEYDSPKKKDTPDPLFLGKSCREAQIAMSEVYAKVFHGDQGVFGKIFCNSADKKGDGIIVVSDSGFRGESVEVVKKYGAEAITLVRIHRPDHDFSKDSRDYVYLDDLGVKSFDILNDRTLYDLYKQTDKVIKDVISRIGQKAA